MTATRRIGPHLGVLLLSGCAALLGIEEGTTQGACESSEDCAPGYSCLVDACQSGCQSDADCGRSGTCLDLGDRRACLPSDAACGDTTECPENTECEAGRCRSLCETNRDCPGGQECNGGFCWSVGGSGGTGGSGGSGGSGGTSGSGGSSGASATGGSSGAAGGPPTGGCGDGVLDDDEECDDENLDPGDGCSDACEPEAGFSCNGGSPTRCDPICGDSLTVGVEAEAGGCDDGARENSDGCNSLCLVEDGWSCTGMPSECIEGCGDGEIVMGEACDDGNPDAGDGCAACALEDGFRCDDGMPTVCMDIDECAERDFICDANADCVNRPSDYVCECRSGWEGTGKICADINECENGTCAVEATCTNNDGGFSCVCPNVYAGDGIVCQDARIPVWPIPAAPSYTIVSAAVARDNVTGLEWQRETDTSDARSAITRCQGLQLDGHDDWRLPTRIELLTLLFKPEGTGLWIDEATFPETVGGYWSSSSPEGWENSRFWLVGFGNASFSYSNWSSSNRMRCVRSVPAGLPAERFTVTADWAVDNGTGLTWKRAQETAATFAAATAACEGFSAGGLSNWRLPTIVELFTLVDEDRDTPAIDNTIFSVSGNGTQFWSSTVLTTGTMLTVQFVAGDGSTNAVGDSVRSRCVHD